MNSCFMNGIFYEFFKLPNRIIFYFSLDKRVTLVGKPKVKTEKKNVGKIDKEKDRKSKKRSAQIAEISVMYIFQN